MPEYTVNWQEHFLLTHIKTDSSSSPGVERPYIESETATEDGLGMKFHHRVYLDKLVTTDAEAELYFKQLMLFFGQYLRKETESFYYDQWTPTQDWADGMSFALDALTSINNIISPANALIGQKSFRINELSPWLGKYNALLFSNRFVRAAEEAGLPAAAQFWSPA